MVRHAYFEELCALAPLGELAPSQLRALDDHIAECEACRQATIDYNRFFQQVVPEVGRSNEEYIEKRRNDMRMAVMQNIAVIDHERERKAERDGFPLSVSLWSFRRTSFALPLFCGFGAVLLTTGAFWLGGHFDSRRMQPQTVQNAASAPGAAPTAPLPNSITQAPVAFPAAASKSDDNEMMAALDDERRRNVELAKKLSVEEDKVARSIAAQNSMQAQIDQQGRALAATKSDLDSETAALAQLHAANSSDGATIASLELQVHDLTEKINTQATSLDRERDLLSHGREIRDIIGARNLHIIDVYDTGTEGTTRRPFARAFYTEGKSLVYYAYDLPQRRIDEGKYSYVAWGQSNGSKASVKKIGLLYRDNQVQHRWTLDFSDPQVLREIDSVFITLERNDEDPTHPKGKRMLTAYLGTAPNHP